MTIRIEFPSENTALAAAIGAALVAYGNGEAAGHLAVTAEEKPALTTAEVVTAIKEEKAATTAAGADTSTDKSTTEVVGANSSEEAGNVDTSLTLSGESQETSLEQLNVKQDAGVADAATDAKVDEKGVAFNEKFCGKAAKPFYGSGKTKGQWKKRQGVAQEDYDTWYSACLSAVTTSAASGQELETAGAFANKGDNVTPIETAGAFTNKQNGEQIADGQNHQVTNAGDVSFADAGEFMKWLSEQQAAELITSGDIDSAYAATQSSMGDLFDPSKATDAIAKVYNFLKPIAAGQQ